MVVSNMDKLEKWVWSRYDAFPFLERLYVNDCPNLIEFSFLTLVSVHKESTEWFPKLHHLTITNCPQLQHAEPQNIIPYIDTRGIIVAEVDSGFGGINYERHENYMRITNVRDIKVLDSLSRTSCNICTLEVYDCRNLTSLLWKYICMIISLKKLTFGRCEELCFSLVVEDKDDGCTSYSHESLEELIIFKCSITGKELSYLLAHLPVVHKLSISDCHGIDYVSLPAGIINETNRASLEAGVEIDKDQQRSHDSLAYLEELTIFDCPDMVFEGGLSGLSSLKNVTIGGSENLLSSMTQQKKSNSVHKLWVKSNTTSLNLYSFTALRELTLMECKRLVAVEGPNSPAGLKVYISECSMLAKMGSEIKPKFLMPVVELNIDNIEFLVIHASSFSTSLKSLAIQTVISSWVPEPHWKEWTEEQEDALIKLFTLEKLFLYGWQHLRSLPSTLHLHPSLRQLTIYYCPEIKSLPQGGFPKTLQKLRLPYYDSDELISQCKQLLLEDFDFSRQHESPYFGFFVFAKRDHSVVIGSQKEFDSLQQA